MEQQPKRSSKKIILIGIVAALILLVGAASVFTGPQYESTDNAQLDGDLFAIRAGVTGFVKELRFTDNQKIEKGDTLIVFDTDELSAKVLQAQAALDNARANFKVSQNNAAAGIKNVTASQRSTESNQQSIVIAKAKLDKAQMDFDRTNELFNIKGATQEQLDNAKSNLLVAKSELNRTINQEQSSIASSEGLQDQAKATSNQVSLAKAIISQREAELMLAQKQMSYAYIIAPCTGIVTKRAFNQGQYVSLGQSLCVVVNTEKYWISANFKETQIKEMSVGSEVEIELDSHREIKLTGKIESFGGATGAKFSLLPPDNATGNFIKITQRVPLHISIDNFPADKRDEIFPGLSAYVKVKTDNHGKQVPAQH